MPPLDEIKAKVTMDFQAERRDQEAIAKLQPVVQELSSGTTLATVAARYETEVKTTPDFGPGGPVPEIGNAPELSAAVFQTAKGQAGPPVPAAGGFVLFRVVNRTAPDPKTFETQKPEILETLQSREAERLLRAELQRLRTDRKIQVERGAPEDLPAGADRSPPGMSQKRELRPETLAVHAGKRSDSSGAAPLVDPIFQTAPFSFPDPDALAGAAQGKPPTRSTRARGTRPSRRRRRSSRRSKARRTRRCSGPEWEPSRRPSSRI